MLQTKINKIMVQVNGVTLAFCSCGMDTSLLELWNRDWSMQTSFHFSPIPILGLNAFLLCVRPFNPSLPTLTCLEIGSARLAPFPQANQGACCQTFYAPTQDIQVATCLPPSWLVGKWSFPLYLIVSIEENSYPLSLKSVYWFVPGKECFLWDATGFFSLR